MPGLRRANTTDASRPPAIPEKFMSSEKKENDYKHTLNLPQTDFPMKANLAAREPEMLKRWEETDLYGKLRAARNGKPKYILHD